jgi:uncharacterized membrane protein YqaE (UPF0057 family)
MKIILAIFLPPVAVLLCGKPLAALLNLVLCLLFWIPGVIHAIYVVMNYDADRRTEQLAKAIGQQGRRA